MFEFNLLRSIEENEEPIEDVPFLVTPGGVVTSDSGFMRYSSFEFLISEICNIVQSRN